VVEPTPSKNMIVKLGSSSPNRGGHKKYFYNPFTNHVLTSCDIQVRPFHAVSASSGFGSYGSWIYHSSDTWTKVPNISSQIVVKNGDLYLGRIGKKSPTKTHPTGPGTWDTSPKTHTKLQLQQGGPVISRVITALKEVINCSYPFIRPFIGIIYI